MLVKVGEFLTGREIWRFFKFYFEENPKNVNHNTDLVPSEEKRSMVNIIFFEFLLILLFFEKKTKLLVK